MGVGTAIVYASYRGRSTPVRVKGNLACPQDGRRGLALIVPALVSLLACGCWPHGSHDPEWSVSDSTTAQAYDLTDGDLLGWRIWATATPDAFPDGEYESSISGSFFVASPDEWPVGTNTAEVTMALEDAPDDLLAEDSLYNETSGVSDSASLSAKDPWSHCAGEDGCSTPVYLLSLSFSGPDDVRVRVHGGAGVRNYELGEASPDGASVDFTMEEVPQ